MKSRSLNIIAETDGSDCALHACSTLPGPMVFEKIVTFAIIRKFTAELLVLSNFFLLVLSNLGCHVV